MLDSKRCGVKNAPATSCQVPTWSTTGSDSFEEAAFRARKRGETPPGQIHQKIHSNFSPCASIFSWITEPGHGFVLTPPTSASDLDDRSRRRPHRPPCRARRSKVQRRRTAVRRRSDDGWGGFVHPLTTEVGRGGRSIQSKEITAKDMAKTCKDSQDGP